MTLRVQTLEQLLQALTDPRRSALLALYEEHKGLFHSTPGSSHNHQAWFGGYADHIAETIRINRLLYPVLNSFEELPFTEDSATIALFFHDIEKPFKYGDTEVCLRWQTRHSFRMRDFGCQHTGLVWEYVKKEIIQEMEQTFGFEIRSDEWNALEYTHGEGSAHRKDSRIATPLAAHVHHCDNTSARIYFDKGQGLS